MSRPQPPMPAKLIVGVFLKDRSLVASVADMLIESFGPVDQVSAWLPFDYTDYYKPEMGAPLYRRLFSFTQLIDQASLSEIKQTTNGHEKKYMVNMKRQVNIDPGYLLHERFVLATGKNFAHRIYIGNGIYADLTLIYTQGKLQTLPWTYPDYASETIKAFILQIRQKYTIDLKKVDRLKTEGV